MLGCHLVATRCFERRGEGYRLSQFGWIQYQVMLAMLAAALIDQVAFFFSAVAEGQKVQRSDGVVGRRFARQRGRSSHQSHLRQAQSSLSSRGQSSGDAGKRCLPRGRRL